MREDKWAASLGNMYLDRATNYVLEYSNGYC